MMQNVFRTGCWNDPCWEKKSWGADDVAPDLRSLFGSVHLAELRGLGPCWPCLSWGVNEDNRFNRWEKAVNFWILMELLICWKQFEFMKVVKLCEIPKIIKFVASQKFQGVFSVFPGALWRSLREEALQAGARGRWTCEARLRMSRVTCRDFFTVSLHLLNTLRSVRIIKVWLWANVLCLGSEKVSWLHFERMIIRQKGARQNLHHG